VKPPLATGSVSLRLYPHDLPPAEVVQDLRSQAVLAERAGFDGVMLSEHHGGFPNYLPNPLLASTWALDATEQMWAAPCPMLLPLRAMAHVVEDLAWTAQRHPGRVGVGFAAGALETDFDLAGVPFAEMNGRFKTTLPLVARALSGAPAGPLADDLAVAALADAPIPVVSAAASPAAAERAGRLELGVVYDSITSIERLAMLSAAHDAAGGGVRILIRRVWVGEPPADAVAHQMARYRAAASDRAVAHWAADGGLVAAPDPVEVAQRLVDQMVRAGCDAVNLRLFHAGLTPGEVRRQIEVVGDLVLPVLRRLIDGQETG
jgi:alkanesulfonate monooxygenase SsuD/methylene tetrahydromethanopterin reductase-like flavin-dependent oxidoreductase (luciferase family)